MLTLSALYRYPMKSTRAQALERAWVSARGMQGDRQWMLVDANNRFVSLREEPAMARIRVHQTDAAGWLASAEGQTPLHFDTPVGEAETAVQIWKESVRACVAADEVNRWFSAVLGRSVRAVWMPDAVQRPVDPQYAGPKDFTHFTDGFPLLLISEASLAHLNQRLVSPVSMAQFRPNLVIAGADAFAEDGWKRLRIGDVELALVKPCSRCVMTTRHPLSGERAADNEPLKTLATFRRQENGVMFGQNVLVRVAGELRVDARVDVLE